MQGKHIERGAALISLLILALAWVGGMARGEESATSRILKISPKITEVTPVKDNLYRAHTRGAPKETLHIAIESHPSYGGPLSVAVVSDKNGIIQNVAILHSTDTRTYLDKVVESRILDPFPGSRIDDLPRVDAISGATLSSMAIITGIEKAGAHIAGARMGSLASKPSSLPLRHDDLIKSAAVIMLFGCALFLSGRRFPWSKKKGRTALMTISALLLGFRYSTQFSLASLHLLISGSWMQGLASYAALLCLVLALAIFFLTRKNLYCASICPFGAVQEGLGRITGCSPPRRAPWMIWVVRLITLLALSAALFFQNPTEASFEPFGMAFNFTGSDALFAMTLVTLIGSLVVKRPWCRLFCPITALFEFLGFLRNQWRGHLKHTRHTKGTP